MTPQLNHAFETEMAAARRHMQAGELDEAFRRIERAHILGQRYVAPHVRSHWLMLKVGLMRGSVAQVWGQAVRIVLGALGSAIGVVPVGNTGGANIGMFKRLPIDPEIAKLLDAQ
jgi:hypothetical protein